MAVGNEETGKGFPLPLLNIFLDAVVLFFFKTITGILMKV